MNEKANFYQSTFGFFFSVDLRRESLFILSVNQKNRLKSRCYKYSFPITKSITRYSKFVLQGGGMKNFTEIIFRIFIGLLIIPGYLYFI